jgi:hypothetical protein
MAPLPSQCMQVPQSLSTQFRLKALRLAVFQQRQRAPRPTGLKRQLFLTCRRECSRWTGEVDIIYLKDPVCGAGRCCCVRVCVWGGGGTKGFTWLVRLCSACAAKTTEPCATPGALQPIKHCILPACRTRLTFQVDSYVENTSPCGTFWKSSKPRGKKVPNAAHRLGLRAVSDQCAAQLNQKKRGQGGVYRIVRMSNTCTNPPRNAKSKFSQRKRFRTTMTPALAGDSNGLFLNCLREKYSGGAIESAAAAWGAGRWTPLPFRYKTGAQPVCIQGQPTTKCAGGWRPSRIVPL